MGWGVDGEVLARPKLLLTLAYPSASAFCTAGLVEANSELAHWMKRWQFKRKC